MMAEPLRLAIRFRRCTQLALPLRSGPCRTRLDAPPRMPPPRMSMLPRARVTEPAPRALPAVPHSSPAGRADSYDEPGAAGRGVAAAVRHTDAAGNAAGAVAR